MTASREALARRLGIQPRFHDLSGEEVIVGPETRDALLRAMGHDPEEAEAALARLEAEAEARHLPPWLVVEADAPVRVDLPQEAAWQLRLEEGSARDGQGGELGALPLGIHALEVAGCVTWLLAAPRRLPLPPRSWGVTLPLYGLKPEHMGGVGSYADLAEAGAALARAGAGFVGVNPIHAGFPSDAGAFSPYSPSSRRWLSVLHVEVGAETSPSPLVDYHAVVPAQNAALRAAFAAAPPPPAFTEWRAAQGEELERFAVHQALSEEHGSSWPGWPEALRDPAAPEVATFAAEQAEAVTFHAWCQWMAETQLAEARAATEAAGAGLYLDLAVGTHPDGAETWAHPEHFAKGVSLGAPPDAFAPGGQNWNLAPLDPQALVALGFRPLAETLRAQFRFARILRIDHILGFDRAFWVPRDGSPGGYVTMPSAAMLAVARIEAARAGGVIVGEDLGNIPPGLREQLDASGILGCRVAMFEQDYQRPPRYRSAGEYDEAVLTSFATHDLPTFRGWRLGRDIDWRARLSGAAPEAVQDERARRAEDVAALDRATGGSGVTEMHALLAGTKSRLVALQMEDILGLTEQPNLPGTVYDHPNWRRRLTRRAADLGGAGELARARAAMQAAGREGEGR